MGVEAALAHVRSGRNLPEVQGRLRRGVVVQEVLHAHAVEVEDPILEEALEIAKFHDPPQRGVEITLAPALDGRLDKCIESIRGPFAEKWRLVMSICQWGVLVEGLAQNEANSRVEDVNALRKVIMDSTTFRLKPPGVDNGRVASPWVDAFI